MAVKIKNLYAQPVGSDKVYVGFEIGDIAEHPDKYTFEVYRALHSEGSPGDWKKIASLTDSYFHLDKGNFMPTPHSIIFYKLKVVRNDGTEDPVESNSVPITQDEFDGIAFTLANKYRTALIAKSGSRCLYFRARRGGFRCPVCWDSTLKSATVSSCRSCFGTGFAKGVHVPIEVFAQFSNKRETYDKSSGFSDTSLPIAIIMSNYPLASIGDFVYEIKRNRAIEVKDVFYLEHRGNIYGQKLMGSQLGQTSPKFSHMAEYFDPSRLKEYITNVS